MPIDRELFSIIMPAYNRESLIREALDSVKAQTYRPIEIIVVDDGSGDGTEAMVKQFALSMVSGQQSEDSSLEVSSKQSAVGGGKTVDREHCAVGSPQVEHSGPQTDKVDLKPNNLPPKTDLASRSWELGDDQFSVRYFYQENAGAGAARNRGIKEIRGEYVQFIDSDDRIHPDRLQRLAETFEKEQCDFIQTGFEGFDADTGEVIQTVYGKPDEDQVELALKGRFWANTLRAALTAELVRSIGPWNTEMTCFEDREYMERAVVNAKNPFAIRDILASARRGGSARISDKLRSYEGRTWRIHCEEQLAAAFRDRTDISYDAKQQFASRIYGLGFRSNASGWPDLGKRCGELAKSMNVKLDALGRRRRIVWRLGRFGGSIYQLGAKIRGS